MGSAVMDEGIRTIYVDPRGSARDEKEARTKTSPAPQRDRWRYRFPWVKTAVSAPTYNGEILIINRTDRTWLLWHNYHQLGPFDPVDERRVRVVRMGTISARPLTDTDAEYLLLSLHPSTDGVEIVDVAAGEGFYALRALESDRVSLADVPGSTTVEELGLSARTVGALRRIGIKTVAQLREADLGALWDAKHGAAAYAELVEKFLLRGREGAG